MHIWTDGCVLKTAYLISSRTLSRFSFIKTITIKGKEYKRLEIFRVLETVSQLLETLRDSTVEEIHLYFDVAGVNPLARMSEHADKFNALKRILQRPEPGGTSTSPAFVALKKLHLNLFPLEYPGKMWENPSATRLLVLFVSDIFRELDSQAVLHVDILERLVFVSEFSVSTNKYD